MIQLGFIIWLRLEADTYLLWNIYWDFMKNKSESKRDSNVLSEMKGKGK
jgi:hypothetical protein